MSLRRSCAVLLSVVLIAAFGMTERAYAVPGPPTLAVPATVGVNFNTSTAVTGLTLTANGQSSIQVQLTVTHGTLSMSTITGLTFATGDGTADAEIQFTATPTDAQAALNTLTFAPTTGYVGSATLTYNTSPGGGLYNAVNGHFYQFIDNGSNISWVNAKIAADALTFGGMTGYLATVTSSSEQAFVATKLNGQGWFGASDAASESDWIWDDGPEAGQTFWQGTYSGVGNCVVGPCSAVSGRYNNWAGGEPNDSGGEDYSHFLLNGQWNDYPVSAGITKYLVEFGGMPGDPSVVDNDTTAITVSAVAPGVPTSVSLTPTNQQLAVSWSAPTSNGGASIDNYIVEYSANGTTWTAQSAVAGTSTTITGLANGTSYQVRVKAHNSVGYGSTTSPSSSTPATTSTAPQSLGASKANGQSVITWTAPASNGGASITGYKVEVSSNGGSSYSVASASTTSPYTLTPLTNGASYIVKVSALNSQGTGASTTYSFVAGGLPSAPQSLTATSQDKAALLAWTAPTSNGGLAISGYRVEYSSDGTTWTTAYASTTSPATITGLTNGVQYQTRVTALNSQGAGASVSTTVTPLGVATAPTTLTANAATTQATISWGAPSDVGGTPVTSYTLEYRVAGGAWTTASTSAQSPSVISGLTPNVAYEARVTAINAVGASGAATVTFTTLSPPVAGVIAPVHVAPDGTVTTVPVFDTNPPQAIVAATPTGGGSWSLLPDGGIVTAGDAGFFGSMGGTPLNSPAVGLAPTANGDGYYVVGADGGVFAFGSATYMGSMGGQPLNAPIKGIGISCSNNGYYLVANDGGVFAYGSVGFFGSMAGKPLNAGMLGIVDSCGRNGYWTFAADGGVFTFGDAEFYGSLGANPPAGGVIGLVSAPDGKGYWLIGADKKAYGFGSVAS